MHSPDVDAPPRSNHHPARPLVITSDEQLLDDLLRLAAAAGTELEVVADAGSARPRWLVSPLVLVGADQAGALVAAPPPRRPGVVLVGDDVDDASVWQRAVALGAEHVLFLPDAEPWLVDRLADAVEGRAGEATTIGVVGGRGGAGASVLAVALAVTAARRGLLTTLVDADPLGGGLDLAIGAEDVHGLRWPDLAAARGRIAAPALTSALPEAQGLTVLSWDRGDAPAVPAPAVRAVVAAMRRSRDLVVVDLPRRLDEAAQEAVSRCVPALLVVPAEVRAVAAAARVATGLALVAPDVRVVVRGPSPSGLRPADVADSLALPLAGFVDTEPGLARDLEQGVPPGRSGRGSLAALCTRLLDEIVPARDVA